MEHPVPGIPVYAKEISVDRYIVNKSGHEILAVVSQVYLFIPTLLLSIKNVSSLFFNLEDNISDFNVFQTMKCILAQT